MQNHQQHQNQRKIHQRQKTMVVLTLHSLQNQRRQFHRNRLILVNLILFNYFHKHINHLFNLGKPSSSKPSVVKKKDEPKKDSNSDDDDDEIIGGSKRKRSRIVRLVDSDDSDRENESDNSQSMDTPTAQITRKKSVSSTVNSPVAKKKIKLDQTSGGNKLSFEEKLQANFAESISLSDVNVKAEEEEPNDIIDAPTVYMHKKLEFLKPQNIRDKKNCKLSDPNYDPGTLYVPEKFLSTLTPAMRQWWEIKSENFDTVIFFKVGKFYELYHMDADVGVTELGFTYMKGEFAHSGFPEQSFNRMATSLVDRGYKVARTEQTETPEMMAERLKHQQRTTKYDKVVKREVCQVVNKGTQVFGQQVAITNEYQPNFMLAIAEKVFVFSTCNKFIDKEKVLNSFVHLYAFFQFSDITYWSPIWCFLYRYFHR